MIERTKRGRAARIGTGLATLAVLTAFGLAGCGSGGASTTGSSPSSASTASDGALRFTECMRQHGVNLPDPAPGANTVEIPRASKSDPKTEQAVAACQHFLAEGNNKNPNDPAEQDAALRLARCLRDHGLTVADPQPGQPLTLNLNTRDPKVLQTVQDCRASTHAGGTTPTSPANGG